MSSKYPAISIYAYLNCLSVESELKKTKLGLNESQTSLCRVAAEDHRFYCPQKALMRATGGKAGGWIENSLFELAYRVRREKPLSVSSLSRFRSQCSCSKLHKELRSKSVSWLSRKSMWVMYLFPSRFSVTMVFKWFILNIQKKRNH